MSSLRNAYDRVSGSDVGIVFRNLTTDGLVGGPENTNVNGAVTPVKFYIQPLDGDFVSLRTVSVILSDAKNIKLEDYGGITGPLTNGIIFYTVIDGVESTLGLPFKSNRQLADLGPLISRLEYGNSASTSYKFNLAAVRERGLELVGSRGDQFGIIVRDDLSALIAHTFSVKGSLRLRSI